MIFFYIRHGDPVYEPDSLTPLGMRQADALAKRLSLYGVDKIYSSTSNRAIQTAMPTCVEVPWRNLFLKILLQKDQKI